MKQLRILLLGLVILLWITPATGAQEEATCPTIVRTAIDSTDAACRDIGRNQLCYGNFQIAATARAEVSDFAFAEVGDVVNVADLQTLQLYPLDEEAGNWGVAIMRIQANIPGTMPGQNVTFVLFGDVEIENLGDPEGGGVAAMPVTLEITAGGVNLRTGPSTGHSVYGTFTGPATVDGRTEDGEWLRMRAPDGSGYVWVAAFVVEVAGDVMTLPVVEVAETAPPSVRAETNGQIDVYTSPWGDGEIRGAVEGTIFVDGRSEDGAWLRLPWNGGAEYMWIQAADVTPEGDLTTLLVIEADEMPGVPYGPMQVFYFRSGVGDAPCEEAPDSGILVQTPRGVGEIAVNVNGVDFAFGSTGYFVGIPPMDGMTSYPGYQPFGLALFNGKARYSGGYLYPGLMQPFAWDGSTFAPWGNPYPFDPSDFSYLPFGLLPNPTYVPYWGTLQSSGWNVVYNYYTPPIGVTPNGCAAVLLHNAGLDNLSWYPWLLSPLLDTGWGVWAPDMPGHGQTGGHGGWQDWLAVTNDGVSYLQSTYGYNCLVFLGSSIGANVAAHACQAWPGTCLGAVLYSPGLDYGGYNMLNLAALLDAPVYIAASTRDSVGGGADVAAQIQAMGDANITTHIYDSDGHGQYLADEFKLWDDMLPWWQQNITPPVGAP